MTILDTGQAITGLKEERITGKTGLPQRNLDSLEDKMPYPKTPQVVKNEIKSIMLKAKARHGIEINAKLTLGLLKAWGARQEISDKIPTSWKTVQKIMTAFRNDGVYDDIEKHGLEHTFLLGESLGEGANQIPWKYAGRARELTEYYLTELDMEPQIGLIRQYIRVSQIDLEWTDVQAKSRIAEIFWAHERMNGTPDYKGSIRFHELQMIFQTWKYSEGSPQHEAFKKQYLNEDVVPWTASVPAEMLPMLPQFKYLLAELTAFHNGIQPSMIVTDTGEFINLPAKSEATEESFMASVKAFEDAGKVVITEVEPQERSADDFEEPLPGTPDGVTIQLMKDSPPLQKIEYDEDGKPIKPWEKNK